MIASLFGNRQVRNADEVRLWLRTLLPELIKAGVCDFYLGNHGQFDAPAAQVLSECKRRYPQICRVLVLPDLQHPFDASLYDETVLPPLENVPVRLRIVRRNEWMLAQADVIIGCAWYRGNASALLEKALRMHKQVYLAPSGICLPKVSPD